MLLAIVLYFFLREPRRGQADSSAAAAAPMSVKETVAILAGRPVVWLLMAAFVGANFVATVFLTWTPTFLVEKFHFQLATAGLSGTAFIHLASAVSAPLGGVLADWLAQRMPAGRIVVQGLGLLVGAVFVAVVGSTENVGTLLAAMTLFGACKGLYDSNIFASLYDFVEPPMRRPWPD